MPSDYTSDFVFFGNSEFSVLVCQQLAELGLKPKLIVSTEDKKAGRGMKKRPPEIKNWAQKNNILVMQPNVFTEREIDILKQTNAQFFLIASYGKIIPKEILSIPTSGCLNIHPSLLPKYRGPSPIQSQILAEEKNLGVTIIKMDEEVDHGPIVLQKKMGGISATLSYKEMGTKMFEEGSMMVAEIFKGKKIQTSPQDDSKATFTKKFTKSDGEIKIDSGKEAYLKYLALGETVGVFFFFNEENRKIRVKIKNAIMENGDFKPKIVIPEGKKQMSYEDFLRGKNRTG